jgi:hypothetical protein
MPHGYVTLGEYPTDLLRLACTRCDRRGQYRKDHLIAEHAPMCACLISGTSSRSDARSWVTAPRPAASIMLILW